MPTPDLISAQYPLTGAEGFSSATFSPIDAPLRSMAGHEEVLLLGNPSTLTLAMLASATLICVGLIQRRWRRPTAAESDAGLIRPRRAA